MRLLSNEYISLSLSLNPSSLLTAMQVFLTIYDSIQTEMSGCENKTIGLKQQTIQDERQNSFDLFKRI